MLFNKNQCFELFLYRKMKIIIKMKRLILKFIEKTFWYEILLYTKYMLTIIYSMFDIERDRRVFLWISLKKVCQILLYLCFNINFLEEIKCWNLISTFYAFFIFTLFNFYHNQISLSTDIHQFVFLIYCIKFLCYFVKCRFRNIGMLS